MNKDRRNSKIKRILSYFIIVFIIFVLTLLIRYYLPKLKTIMNYNGLQNMLITYENKAKYIFFIICFLQPIILPIPEPVSIMAGSSVFGPFNGAIIGFCGTILGIITMFIISRYASKNIINKLVDSKKVEKFNDYIKKNELLVISALFILPILPDEVICAGTGISKINGYKFVAIAIISKLITEFSLAYSVKIISWNLKSILIIACVLVFIVSIKLIRIKKLKIN